MLADFWDEMYTPPLTFLPVNAQLSQDLLLISRKLRMTATSQRERSLNWSGAYITPRDGQQFIEVHGRWDVPEVAAPATMPQGDEYRSSIWIGLDGQRRYFDSSLPQIGTTQSVNPSNGVPYWTWFQWWLRDNAATYVPIPLPVPVAPGNRMLASLRFWTETEVHFTILNRTTGDICWFTMDSPTDFWSGKQAKVSGATAEWVFERPSDVNTLQPYELPDYNEAHFTNCFALSAVVPPGLPPGPAIERTLNGARVINMYDVERNPSRTVTISKTERPDVDRFDTEYVD